MSAEDVRDSRVHRGDGSGLRDEEIVREVRAGEREMFNHLLRRYNQRLYRIARAVLRSDQEAEDVVQETWLRAFCHLGELAQPAVFAAWVSRIALYEAWARARRGRRMSPCEPELAAEGDGAPASPDPERTASDHEIRSLVESAIESLPEKYRVVLVLRGIEGMSTAEVARALNMSRVAVSTRFHRARAILRKELFERVGLSADSFAFLGVRCERLRRRIMACVSPLGDAWTGG